MRIPSSVFAVGRYAVAFVAVAGSLVLMSATKKTNFTKHDKAFYADANTVNFVRPGLVMKIVSTNIASDGTISIDYKLTDPKGLPLDQAGVTTPGAVSVSFLMAYIPKGETQFYSYAVRTQTSTITGKSAIQAGADSGGTSKQVGDGEYLYTFKTKAVAKGGGAWDPTAVHRAGIYGSRNLTEFDLGTNYDSDTYTYTPSTGAVTAGRDVIRTASCDRCHDETAFHGGSRRGMDTCIMCHTPQTIDPDTGNTLDMKVFVHKLHTGADLPSVKAGKPYQIIGFNNAVSDWSTVEFPANGAASSAPGVLRCETCHEPQSKTGATQADAWLKNPSRDACGACHDDVKFATGENHVNLPQVSDNQCSTCHIPQGELEFDASIRGAHTYPQESKDNPGMVFTVQKIENGGAGQKPTVTFTVRDFKGNGINPATVPGGRLSLVLAGPTNNPGYTNFGSDVNTKGYVAETATTTAKCAADGTCSYTFTHAIPANATGTYSVGLEGRRTFTVLPGTKQEQTISYGAKNVVFDFSVDASKVQPRRQVVALAKCNTCHVNLSLHGENRNQIEQCVLCHNPSMDDSPVRSQAVNAADKNLPPQGVNFAMMIHKIHRGETMQEDGATYIIVGNGGSHNDFSDVRYPVMGPTGGVADTAKCDMCHVNNSEASFPIGQNAVADQQGKWNPTAPATTNACTACHIKTSTFAHAAANYDPKFGESCDVCHGVGADFDVQKMHAGK
ncbi:MAG TPA: OmcA/MtrC family decaheme c-type cytochrome [Bryobacteraceae bacterium]